MNSETIPTHHESITISKKRGLPVIDVVLKTTTRHFIKDNVPTGGEPPVLLLPSSDSHLLSILSKYNMTSLLVSTASSSSQSSHGLPVGTMIQYRNESLHNNNNNNYDIIAPDHRHVGPSIQDQLSLLKLLSHHGLLCHNVPQESFRNGNIHALHDNHDTVVFMLPNDAYSLCHTKTLIEQIIDVAPCRDFYGIYSQYDANLNHEQVTDKALWVKVEKLPHDTTLKNGTEHDSGYEYSIERAIAYSFWPLEKEETLSFASLLGGHGDFKMQACPLSKTSVWMVKEGGNLLQEQEFTNSALDMYQDITIHLHRDDVSKDGNLKVERSIQRKNGISHKGKFVTKVYYDGSPTECSHDLIQITLVDVYPTIVSPLYHSFKIYLMEESQSTVLSNMTNTHYLNIQELDHTLSIRDHGLSSLTLNFELPINTSLFVEMDYLPKFLSFESFPAEPNRGFDIPPSFVSYICPLTKVLTTQPQMVFSNALLIMPPVPDLSMPYNVISITSTFFALIIGTIINITIKRANQSLKDQYNGVVQKRGITKLKEFIVRMIHMLKRRSSETNDGHCRRPNTDNGKMD